MSEKSPEQIAAERFPHDRSYGAEVYSPTKFLREGYAACVQERELPLQARIAELEIALLTIEKRLREDTGPILELLKSHGDSTARRAWKKAIYASAIHAQIALGSDKLNPPLPTPPQQ